MPEWPFHSLPRPLAWFLYPISLIFRLVPQDERSPPKMTSALIGLRYFAFGPSVLCVEQSTRSRTSLTPTSSPGLFIVCNTILCSVGVWNLSLVQRKSSYNCSCLPFHHSLLPTSRHLRSIISTLSVAHLKHTQYTAQISAYVIFLGAFSLLWIFPM